MINGLDYSMGMPDIATMKQGNVAFVCRYVGWSDLAQTKILTPTEAQTLSQNGIAIVSNYEWYGSRPQEGVAAADVDAARALQIHKSCGGSDTAPIYFSVDYDSPGSDVAEYFRELGRKLGIQRVGAYGGYRCIKYLFDNGLITWGWQTYAWSGGQWDSRAQIRQTQNAVQFGGIEVDFDTGMVDNVGQWKVGAVTTPVVFNSKGLVMDIDQTNQMFEGEQDLCGPWSVAALLYANVANKGVLGTGEDIDVWVDAAVKDMGYPDPAKFPGVSIADMEWLLKRAGLNYWEIPTDWASVRAAINAGYPVIVTAYEPDIRVFSFAQNDWVPPYPWSVQANHVFPVGGFDHNGNPVCADQLNATFQGYWPPIYNLFPIHWAVAVRIRGLAPIPSGTPLSWPAGFNAQIGGNVMPVPSGWKDDGSKLTSPNGHYAVFGMRSHIINTSNPAWDPADYLVEEEQQLASVEESNTSIGKGAAQTTRKHRLGYTTRGGVYETYLGVEYLFVKADRDAKAAALSAANAQIAQLQAQVQQLEQSGSAPSNLADIKANLDKLAADTAAAAKLLAGELAAVEAEVASDLPPSQ